MERQMNNHVRPRLPHPNPHRHHRPRVAEHARHPPPSSQRINRPRPPSESLAPWDVTLWIDPVREPSPRAKS